MFSKLAALLALIIATSVTTALARPAEANEVLRQIAPRTVSVDEMLSEADTLITDCSDAEKGAIGAAIAGATAMNVAAFKYMGRLGSEEKNLPAAPTTDVKAFTTWFGNYQPKLWWQVRKAFETIPPVADWSYKCLKSADCGKGSEVQSAQFITGVAHVEVCPNFFVRPGVGDINRAALLTQISLFNSKDIKQGSLTFGLAGRCKELAKKHPDQAVQNAECYASFAACISAPQEGSCTLL